MGPLVILWCVARHSRRPQTLVSNRGLCDRCLGYQFCCNSQKCRVSGRRLSKGMSWFTAYLFPSVFERHSPLCCLVDWVFSLRLKAWPPNRWWNVHRGATNLTENSTRVSSRETFLLCFPQWFVFNRVSDDTKILLLYEVYVYTVRICMICGSKIPRSIPNTHIVKCAKWVFNGSLKAVRDCIFAANWFIVQHFRVYPVIETLNTISSYS